MPRMRRRAERAQPLLLHLTTVDMSLELLLGPQLRAFVEAGYEVVGVSAPGPYVAALEADGIRHVPLDHATRSFSLGSDIRALIELVKLFRRLRPDVVHTHNPKPGVYGRIAARLAGVPVIVNTVHGLFAQPTDRWQKRAVVYALERMASVCSQTELVQNPEDLATLRRLRVPSRKLVLLGNGVDLSRFQPGRISNEERRATRAEMGADDDDVLIGCVARMVNEKGIPELIAAAESVMRNHPRARFALIGPHDATRADDVPTELLDHARSIGVRVLGHRSDVVPYYAAMDVFALPSHREGYPRSVMEAASLGVPTVATDIRGCREAVTADSGVLIPVRDAGALAAALGSLVDDDRRRQRLSAGSRQLAHDRFDVRRQIEISLDAYERGLRRRGIPRPSALAPPDPTAPAPPDRERVMREETAPS